MEPEVDRPMVGDDEGLVRVHATPVSGTDRHLSRGLPYLSRFVIAPPSADSRPRG